MLGSMLGKGRDMTVNKRVHPSKSYVNSALKLCLCLAACCPRVRASLCLRRVPRTFRVVKR